MSKHGSSWRELNALTGGLSKPSKMPGHGYGLPARACVTGSRLNLVKGTVCSGCYARKGRYAFPDVQHAQYRRLRLIHTDPWPVAMAASILKTGDTHFRWHDSGDLQSSDHFKRICLIARMTPDVRHWLPTKERGFVLHAVRTGAVIPSNLTVRVSAYKVDGAPFPDMLGTVVYADIPPVNAFDCPASKQGNQCGSCRACWDSSVQVVAIKRH